MSTASGSGSGRERFLQRVRAAVAAGNRPGGAPPLDARGTVGYQGAGPDPAARFGIEWATAGGQLWRVPDHAGAAERVVELVQARMARRVLLGGGLVAELGLADRLQALGIEIAATPTLLAGTERETFFAADVGVSGVDYLIAETGSLVLLARAPEPRSLSLLPPVHIAVAETSQILPDLFDLFARLSSLPSCLTLITGPSKTGDIELRLVTGVHGPGEVHVVLIGS